MIGWMGERGMEIGYCMGILGTYMLLCVSNHVYHRILTGLYIG